MGRPRGCTIRQFSDGALRSEARNPPGPSLAASPRVTKANVSDTVWGRKKTGQQKREKEGGKTVPLMCFFGLLAPSPGNLPGSAATGASLQRAAARVLAFGW